MYLGQRQFLSQLRPSTLQISSNRSLEYYLFDVLQSRFLNPLATHDYNNLVFTQF
jgi:hypothetical protein